MASSSSNVVGVHYRVGKKIGEGSFGVIFEGTNLLNNQQVAIKFVSSRAYVYSSRTRKDKSFASCSFCLVAFFFFFFYLPPYSILTLPPRRNLGRVMHHSFEMSTARTKFSLVAVSHTKPIALTPTTWTVDTNTTRFLQLAFPMSITLDRRVCTTFLSSTCSDLHSRIFSTTADVGSRLRLSSWSPSRCFPESRRYTKRTSSTVISSRTTS